ncbi:Methylated DNA-protein cysteine methyltransferase [Halanaeroarchaeum sp. HSR-CO]|uniref:MGMT family protein n=1 Tax=Halanaeroarchaeum sp. HSR-CO TaxID=2866382 RepID=UPI00217D5E6E|nr:MGMT family protein [Halanaeroarchaeum sp. HSR-CO]UWG47254.1 Methylated DNA-protein cysteine methyltransferase [Halanaeroarchaeum sp. HSR-CO]
MEAAGIYARESATLDRYVQIGVVGSKVISVSFPETPDQDAEAEHALLDRIFGYLDGEPDEFQDVDVAFTIPTDQRAVLDEVRTIPYGKSASVEAVARTTAVLADVEEGETVVRNALRANPAPLVVPAHRVTDGPNSAPPAVTKRLRDLEGL